ncbi:DUF1819 family protein [Rhodococcoides fascians]|uniref:DUF1819 family protein n=1 Tax=Rhodococcoides fascians TaxID=1828 RepID=UPI001E5437E2|nr:DUF1819 family protein [Rhodococcus fascians]
MSDGRDILNDFADGQNEVHMIIHTSRASRYALSFTSGALLMREALIAAPMYLREHDWMKVRQLIDDDNLLQSRTVATGRRLAREVAQRLSVLSDGELGLVIEATTSERGHLLWTAACRRYRLIGEFAEEVLRERFLLLTATLDYDDFDGFIRSKALWHEEVANLKSSTLQRLRSNLFQMLVEAGLLTDDGLIVPTVLSSRVSDVLSARTPSDIRYFPTAVGVQ